MLADQAGAVNNHSISLLCTRDHIFKATPALLLPHVTPARVLVHVTPLFVARSRD
jgi:hypothetical protein